MNALQWRRSNRQTGFEVILKFLENEIPSGRAVIVIMILSDSQESNVFTEAVCQMCSCFPDQYVILSESGQLAVPIEDELVRRSYTEQRTCNERSVSGIPWKHVNFVV